MARSVRRAAQLDLVAVQESLLLSDREWRSGRGRREIQRLSCMADCSTHGAIVSIVR
jgi:hypothetical protein